MSDSSRTDAPAAPDGAACTCPRTSIYRRCPVHGMGAPAGADGVEGLEACPAGWEHTPGNAGAQRESGTAAGRAEGPAELESRKERLDEQRLDSCFRDDMRQQVVWAFLCPEYCLLARDAIELGKRLRQERDTLSEFFDKYALGSKSRPSCFSCGRADWKERPIAHAELPDIFLCERCVAALRGGEPPAGWPTDEQVERACAALKASEHGPLIPCPNYWWDSAESDWKVRWRKHVRAALLAAAPQPAGAAPEQHQAVGRGLSNCSDDSRSSPTKSRSLDKEKQP